MIVVTEIKEILCRKLLAEHGLWSYDITGMTCGEIPDELLVLHTLLYLDLDDVNLLFHYYPPAFIKRSMALYLQLCLHSKSTAAGKKAGIERQEK